MKFIFTAIFILFSAYAIGQDRVELKRADKLEGRTENGKTVREASGNVHFTQGNINVYCNSATHYVDENRVVLVGNVRIHQDTLTLTTSRGTYNGNDRTATGTGGITLQDPNATLRANNGTYSFNDAKAVFTGNVIIVNPAYRITSSQLTYMRSTEDSFARGNVIVTTDSAIMRAESVDFFKRQGKTIGYDNASIVSDSTTITADTLTNFDFENRSVASGNVKIVKQNNNAVVTGDYLENFEDRNYTKISGNAELIQIEGNDTTFIYSTFMEAFRDPPEHYIATDSVEVIRGDFLSKSGKAIYYRDEETVSLFEEPVVWQNRSQMTGDSIYAELPGEKLQTINVRKIPEMPGSKFSFVISENENIFFSDRYDQIRGTDITMHFVDDKINFVEVLRSAQSIYYVYEDEKANGVNKTEGEDMFIYFDEAEDLTRISVIADPVGQYLPETSLGSADLTLPGFQLRVDKPARRLPQ